ncbi:DUF89 family protein [bacterium]|nr:DUF89 family protein [bacterium]
MKSDIRCTPCLLKQLERSAKALNLSNDEYNTLLSNARREVPQIPLSLPPNIYSTRLLEMLYKNGADPYRKEKARHNDEVEKMIPFVREAIERSENPQRAALLAACLGNVIDLGTRESTDTAEIKEFLEHASFARDDSALLLEKIKGARTLVYVLDNAGEVVLDRLCADFLNVPLTFFVAKEQPILNDVTVSELADLGFPKERVLSTGSNSLGIDWPTLNPEVRNLMREADVVIAKGHANFESFVDGPQEAFLLLKVKCEVVAEKIKEDAGSLVCMHYAPKKNG